MKNYPDVLKKANHSTESIQAGSSEYSIFLGIKTQRRSNKDHRVAEYELQSSDNGSTGPW